jgi:flavin reductase (DIM6/NTAB) family NADH-FMN oxidoreductase RutF
MSATLLEMPLANGEHTDFSSRDFRNAMGQFATGVVVITTEVDGQPHAMTANAFMSGSLEPPLVLVSVACTARMHEKIPSAGGFGISILCDEQLNTSNHFAGKPLPEHQPQFVHLGELPVVDGAAVQLTTQLVESHPCGDHTLFVGRVQTLRLAEDPVAPLLFHCGRYSALAQTQPN